MVLPVLILLLQSGKGDLLLGAKLLEVRNVDVLSPVKISMEHLEFKVAKHARSIGYLLKHSYII